MILLSSTLTFRRCGGGQCHLLWFLLLSMSYSVHVAVNICVNCSLFTFINIKSTRMSKQIKQTTLRLLTLTHVIRTQVKIAFRQGDLVLPIVMIIIGFFTVYILQTRCYSSLRSTQQTIFIFSFHKQFGRLCPSWSAKRLILWIMSLHPTETSFFCIMHYETCLQAAQTTAFL